MIRRWVRSFLGLDAIAWRVESMEMSAFQQARKFYDMAASLSIPNKQVATEMVDLTNQPGWAHVRNLIAEAMLAAAKSGCGPDGTFKGDSRYEMGVMRGIAVAQEILDRVQRTDPAKYDDDDKKGGTDGGT